MKKYHFARLDKQKFPKYPWDCWLVKFDRERKKAFEEREQCRYLGKNFRERERIKRKKQRWIAKLANMPMLERRALMNAIDETF